MQTLAVAVNAIVLGQTTGVIRSGDPKQMAWAVWAMMHGLATPVNRWANSDRRHPRARQPV